MTRSLRFVVAALAGVLVAGCAKTYMITQPLAQPLVKPITFVIAEVKDELPTDMPAEKKPRAEDLQKLQRYLGEEIASRRIGQLVDSSGAEPTYEVQGSLLEYKRGSGAARFFIGFGVGRAHATVGLKLVDRKTGTQVFAGNFYGDVASWTQSGDQTFRTVSKNFAKELEKQMKAPAVPS